jgi:phosphoserine aminotransferase
VKTFFTPGPSQLYPGIDTFFADALKEHVMSMSHRSGAFSDMFDRTVANLRTLMDIPSDYHIFFLGSATEAMERIIQNTVESRSHHFVNGAFAKRFFTTAQELRKQATETRSSWGDAAKGSDMHVPKGTELAVFTHNETSTGAALHMEDIYAFKRANPEVLVAVDVVSSAPIVKLDFSYLDCVFFSVQKAFGLPAGVGVLIVSPAALAKAQYLEGKTTTGSHHSFASLVTSAVKSQTPATPNVLGMYLLGRVAADMNDKGIDQLRERITGRAARLYELLETHAVLRPFVKDPEYRSDTVIVAQTQDSTLLARKLANEGLMVGKGYGDYKTAHLRIANFPATSGEHVDQLMTALQQCA